MTEFAGWAIAVLIIVLLLIAVVAWDRDMTRNAEEAQAEEEDECVTTVASGQEASATSDPTNASAEAVRQSSTGASASQTPSTTDYCLELLELGDHTHLTCLLPDGHLGAHRAHLTNSAETVRTFIWATWLVLANEELGGRPIVDYELPEEFQP